MKEKRIISVILTAAMLISAVSCAESPEKSDTNAEIPEIVKYDGNYRLRDIDAPTGIFLEIAPLNDGFLIAAADENGLLKFYTADSTLKEFSECEIPIPVSETGDISFKMCGAGDNTVYVAVTENINNEYSNILYHINADCTIIAETPLTGIGEIGINLIAEKDGKVFVTSDSIYAVGDNNGVGEPLEGDNYGGITGISAGGELCRAYFTDNKSLMKIGDKTIDLEQCGMPVSNITGGGKYDAVFATNKGICGISGNSVVELASNVMLGLEVGSVHAIYPAGEDFLIASYDHNLNCSKIYLLTESEEEERHETVTLKMGVFYEEDGFSSFLSQQNGSDSYVKIEPVYYTQFDVYDKENDKPVSSGLDQLNMDIISGDAPDMAVFMNPPQYLTMKGAFADMYTLMDDELSRDDFLPNVLEACETNGKLYSLPTSYRIWTMLCKDRFSPIKNQTFDDMLDTFANAPEGTRFQPTEQRSEIFTSMLSYSDFAANCKDGVYSVDRDNMKRLLEFCNDFPAEYEESLDYDAALKESVYSEFSAHSFGDFTQLYASVDEPVTFTGYPSENGRGTVIDPVNTVTVLESCSDKEAAWEFIKCMYASTNITNGINSGFPVLQETSDGWAEAAGFNMSDDQMNQILEVLNSANSLGSGIDNDLFRIITEEADGYFAGQYTSDQAADLIKNRTDIFVSEKS